MRTVSQLMIANAVALLLFLTAGQVMAQTDPGGSRQRQGNNQGGRGQRQGNFDPAQFRQRMMERYRERLEITDDAEWKAVQPLVQNVLDARAAMGTGGRGGRGRAGRPGGEGNAETTSTRPARAPENPAASELQKAIDEKAPASTMKS